jgi:MFS family permease
MDNGSDKGGDPGEQPAVSRTASMVGITLVSLIYILSFIDRKAPFILIESIKADLHLSDTQIGLLTGIAFTLVYAIGGIPLAALAERRGRKLVIASCVLVWSALTAAGGLATNFCQLLLTRVGVALGEAGATPASHSLIAQYFPRNRTTALAVFSAGAPIGVLFGLAGGGLINDLANWRVAMFILGVPGIVLSVLAFLFLKEPPRPVVVGEKPPAMIDGLREVFKLSTIRHLAIAGVFFGIAGGSTMTFTPAFAMRTFGLSSTHVGTTYGMVVGAAGAGGVLLSGFLADRLRRRDQRWGLWLVSGVTILTVPFHLLAWNAPSYGLFILFLLIPELFQSFHAPPTFSAIQSVTPVRYRAMGSAAFLLCATGVGITLGPFIAGFLSDNLRPIAGKDSLKWALCFLTVLKLFASVHFMLAASHLRRETTVESGST